MMKVFVEPGRSNTDETLKMALEAAARHQVSVLVLASNSGQTAYRLLELKQQLAQDSPLQVVVVSHVCEFTPGQINEMPDETRADLTRKGCRVITAAHALSAGERSFSRTFGGAGMLEIVAHTLRLFGQGTKVGLEIGLMARDAGAITPGLPIVAIGGSGRGADTALLLTPGTSASLLESKIHAIICKPGLY